MVVVNYNLFKCIVGLQLELTEFWPGIDSYFLFFFILSLGIVLLLQVVGTYLYYCSVHTSRNET